MSVTGQAQALWYTGQGRAELRMGPLPAPGRDEVLVRTLWSGISRGTERLVFEGRVPASEHATMRAPLQEGAFPFPVKYGYSAVGIVEQGPTGWPGRTVFALHPHQDRFVAPVAMLTPVPGEVPARRAVLAANMETALNAIWDAGCGPADRIVVVGAGIVGLLVGALAARLPGAHVTLVDPAKARRPLAEAFGAQFLDPEAATGALAGTADMVFHASATAVGLALALDCAGYEATVVEMSWYGVSEPSVPLGRAFHSRRLRLVSSQVGAVSPSRRPRWDTGRRLAAALDLLADDRLDALITETVPFEALPAELPRILAPGAPGLATAVHYPQA